MKLLETLGKGIDLISNIFGRIGWLLILYAMVLGLFEVILRYVFNSPTQWIALTIQFSMVLLACVAGPYALNNNEFVKLDVFYERLSNRTKAIVDTFPSVLTYLYLYVLITRGFDAAFASFRRLEMTPTSVQLPVYPLKFAIPIAAIITMLVVLKKSAMDIRTIVGNQMEVEQSINHDEKTH